MMAELVLVQPTGFRVPVVGQMKMLLHRIVAKAYFRITPETFETIHYVVGLSLISSCVSRLVLTLGSA
jgi:hypothetical protein